MHVHRHIICQHRVEVEVTPANAEASFRDERFVHPVNTIVQFQARVFNAPSNRVKWEVLNLAGGPGAGTIDEGGLYTSPLKGSHPFSLTDVVAATSVDDPFRRAFAHVAIAGLGPEPKPLPRVEVFPHRVHLYYPQGHRNTLMDTSNTIQLFRAVVRNADPGLVQWTVDGVPVTATGPEFLYALSGSGSAKTVKVQARIPGSPAAISSATVSLLNYDWPELT